MMKLPLIVLLASLVCGPAAGQGVEPTRVHVNGVELAFIERGQGEPLILLHGGQGDYRSWGPQMEAFSKNYRVVCYSRRYNYPNDNPLSTTYRSAYTDAGDLAAFIQRMRLGRVHLVGTSAGALTALVLATEHPEMVRSLVLAEPPVHAWAREDPTGRGLYGEFMTAIWEPAAAAFRNGEDEAAMRILVDGFGGKGRFDGLPPEARAVAMQNALPSTGVNCPNEIDPVRATVSRAAVGNVRAGASPSDHRHAPARKGRSRPEAGIAAESVPADHRLWGCRSAVR